MKKLFILLFAATLTCSVLFAQDTASGEKKEPTPTTEKKEAKAEKKEAKAEKKEAKKHAKAEKKAEKKAAKEEAKEKQAEEKK